MITEIDIKQAISSILKEKIGYKIYSNNVKEGYKTPCFFIQLLPVTTDLENTNTIKNNLMIEIVYFSNKKSDLDNMTIYNEVKNFIFPVLAVKDRKLIVKNFNYLILEDNIMSIRFNLNYRTQIVKQEKEKMQNIEMKMEE